MYSIEEPPPPSRPTTVHAPKPTPLRSRVPWPLLAAVGVAVVSVLVTGILSWTAMRRRVTTLEAELTGARQSMEATTGSLQLLWTTMTRLDETQDERQARLADSLGAVLDFAEVEVSRWDSAYDDQADVLRAQQDRLRRSDATMRQLLDAATRTNTRVDALMSRSAMIESDLRRVTEAEAALRESLSLLTTEFTSLEHRFAGISSRFAALSDVAEARQSDQLRMAGRIEAVESWIDAFRGARLDAGAVRDRLASLSADLRALSLRVDSLRAPVVTRPVTSIR